MKCQYDAISKTKSDIAWTYKLFKNTKNNKKTFND